MPILPTILHNILMEPPSAEQINPYDDLDGRVACQHFLGKTQEQAEAMFREHAEYYQGDLMWMGPVAFRFYLPAAIRFLRDETATGQPQMICGFAGTLEHRLQYEPAELTPVANELADICGYIVANYDRCGDLPKTPAEMAEQVEGLRAIFAKHTQLLGEIFTTHPPEDFIDLRPRYTALQKAFSELASNPK